jgi:plastocyanin
MRAKTVLVIAVMCTVLIPTSALGRAQTARHHTVVLENNSFYPGNLTVGHGDSVTWVWHDHGIVHNVISRSFHSKTQTYGSYTVRFTHSGTFKYTCTVHPGMDGKVTVR